MTAFRLLAFCLFVCVCAACAGGEAVTSVARWDSAGVTIVESSSPGWSGSEAWSVDPEPLLDLATSGTGEAHWFYMASDATRLPDGSIAVAENNADEIRFFSGGGAFLRAVGRGGEGPGEFRWPSSVDRYRGDSLIVFDPQLSRVTILDPQWEASRIVSFRLPGAQVRDLRPLGDTTFVARAPLLWVPQERDGLYRKPDALIRLSAAGEVMDTIATVAGYEEFQWESGAVSAVPLFLRDSHFAVHQGRIYVGDADQMEFRVYSVAGQLEYVVRAPTFDLSLSGQEIQAEREARLGLNSSARRRDLLDAIPDPETRPAYSDLLVDSDGFIWAEHSQGRTLKLMGDRPSQWTVFSPDGEWLGAVELPGRFYVFEIGWDYVLGRRHDDQDVEHVELLRLNRH
ncbi:hypothetical protein ACFL3S_09455 [Gemmatimonadota bacterium]